MTAIDTSIVAYRSEDMIAAAVDRAKQLGGRVVVVDNGDGSSARVAACSGAVAIHDASNPGFGTGQNRGVAFTGSEFVLLCNPDAEIVPSAVFAGADLLRCRAEVAMVQGAILNQVDGTPERSAGVELGPLHLLGRAVGAKALLRVSWVAALARRSARLRDHADRLPSAPVDVESLAATAVLVRRSAFDGVGGFDETYFLYGEDTDLCRRLRAAGWKLVAVPDVWATHTSGGSAESSWTREANWWRGTLQFAAAWWRTPAWRVAVLAAVLRWVRLAARHPRQGPAAFRAMVVDPFRRRAGSWRGGVPKSVDRVLPAVTSGGSASAA